MTLAENKRTAIHFLTGSSEGRRDVSVLADDVRWWVPGQGYWDRDFFFSVGATFQTLLAEPIVLTIKNITAEDDRVAVEAAGDGLLADGRRYQNDYHFLFLFREGKISEVHEHNDSLVPYMMFGDKLPARTLPERLQR